MQKRSLSSILVLALLAGAGYFVLGPEFAQVMLAEQGIELPLASSNANAPAESSSQQGETRPSSNASKPEDYSFSGTFTLAVSWQSAFCEQRSFKPECQNQTASDASALAFSLHGLWPEPYGNEFCGVSNRDEQADRRGDWRDLPALDLSAATRAELDEVMPGTQSYLHRHEWIKHGTCANTTPEGYYAASLELMEQLNNSQVQELFESALGQSLRANEIRDAFDRAFGNGAGARVTVECADDGNRRIIDELRLSLEGTITPDLSLAELLKSASTRQRGCPQGVVDRVGQQ